LKILLSLVLILLIFSLKHWFFWFIKEKGLLNIFVWFGIISTRINMLYNLSGIIVQSF
jgi:hypothetical protein